MDGIEKITARIQADGAQELERLRQQTQDQLIQIHTQTQQQMDKEREDILERGRKAADERRERLKSAAEMERRKLLLGAKQEVLSQAFDRALEQLCALPEEQYIQLLTSLVLQAVTTGREQIIFSPKDRNRIGKQVVVAANETLVSRVAPELPDSITDSKVGVFLGKVVNSATAQITGTGLLSMSEETRNIQGGFILVDGPVETNCAFETLVRLQREKLEKDVANVLFD